VPAPSSSLADQTPKAPLAESKTKPVTPSLPTGPSTKSDLLLVQASNPNATTSPAPSPSTTTSTTTTTTSPGPVEPDTVTDNGGVGVSDSHGHHVRAVLALFAPQANLK